MLQFLQHLKVVLLSIPFSIIISVPIGFFISGKPKLAKIIIYICSILMTIPSLALFGIMVVVLAPVKLGIGITPAILAIMMYSLLPIIRNTYAALNSVSPRMIEAAKGIGLTGQQILFRIKLPLSIPVIMAGVRNAIVLGVSVATYASLVGAGGLGYFIFSGIGRANFLMVLSGALVVSALGIGINMLLMKVEEWLTPRGLKITPVSEERIE
ncbi:ABC transporter permease [Sediminispirochaeta smaragdinae]|uniref:Binding-protein-dependent transport systems inner membrane component n=1 Tax=Sediminispirochaeta smaragdinae (strain DSM 11293 / JCM 15392 / SEBR 4228) TaxID=573413 RepID=E1RCR0_SEDSS|nr:ABC transporter permease [Sediminispirochaeta smaragdinae]ADK80140.1 binding-protein-dependent transport systems inner membrane component [Sediminispirochaeta smaragdinae DSM 11293]